MTRQTVGSVSKPPYQYNVNMFTSTLERRVDNVYVDINIKICTEESVTVVVSHRPKREAAQKAKSSIHSTLIKPKTPDLIKYVSYFTAVYCVTFRPRI